MATQTGGSCRNCGERMPTGFLVCARCGSPPQSADLSAVVESARAVEARGDLAAARAAWLSALRQLPPESPEAQQARDRVQYLDWELAQRAKYHQPSSARWAKVLGPLGAVGAFLMKFKGVVFLLPKIKFLLSFASFIAIYWAMFGKWFGIGFALLILVHELGHFVDIKRRGLPAELPVFLPGFGAYVRWQAMNVPLDVRAAISLAGPLAGTLGAAFCYVMWLQTHVPVWGALARTTAWLNALNLIPVWQLDGGQAAFALSKLQRGGILAAALAFAVVLREPVFFFVALGAGWRTFFSHDQPEQGSFFIAVYWVVLMACLGLLMWATPTRGF